MISRHERLSYGRRLCRLCRAAALPCPLPAARRPLPARSLLTLAATGKNNYTRLFTPTVLVHIVHHCLVAAHNGNGHCSHLYVIFLFGNIDCFNTLI